MKTKLKLMKRSYFALCLAVPFASMQSVAQSQPFLQIDNQISPWSQQFAKEEKNKTNYQLNITSINLATERLSLPLSDGSVVELQKLSAKKTSSGGFIWRAQVISSLAKQFPGDNMAIVVVNQGQVAGTIYANGRMFKLANGSQISSATLTEIDQSRIPAEHNRDYNEVVNIKQTELAQSVNVMSGGTSVIRVLVGYTSEALRQNPGMQALIDLAVAETNQGFVDSGVNVVVELAHAYELNYNESGDHGTDLDRFHTPNDGYMDDVYTIRDNHQADVAAILIGNADACGRARAIGATEDTAFMVVKDSCATGYYSFGHELGHLMSARHNPEKDNKTTPYPFGHGFLYTQGGWRSIMSYNSNSCCTRQNFWSDPTRTFQGVTRGTTDTHDNARVLNLTAPTIAAFRNGGSVNTPPNADFSTTIDGLTVTFNDLSSDAENNIVSTDWDFGDGNGSNQQNPIHTYASEGSYQVTLTVNDSDNAQDSFTRTVSVSQSNVNLPPSADFTYNAQGLSFSFIDQSNDSDGNITQWLWDFGDGNTASNQNPNHTYNQAGTYSVSLTVSDDQSATETTSRNVVVTEPTSSSFVDFESGMGEWTQSSINDWDWSLKSGSTASSSTGPNQGAFGSQTYLYVETSKDRGAYYAGEQAAIESEAFDAQQAQLSFDYHMYGSNIGTLAVDIFENGTWQNNVWQISGQQHSSSSSDYTSTNIDLSNFSGVIKARLRVVAVGGYRGDIAIDNLGISASGGGNPVGEVVTLAELDFESGLGNWQNSGDFVWETEAGTTPSSSTGPSEGAVTTGYYAYVETSKNYAYNAGDSAMLESELLSGTERSLEFHYHMYGENIGQLSVDIYHQGSWQNDVFVKNGQQHSASSDAFTKELIDLSSYSGEIKVRFRTIAAGNWKGDIAIDDVKISGKN